MHRSVLASAALLALTFGASGCIFQHLAPEQQLTDQAYAYNDEVRWARIDLAAQRVHPDYRATFLASHAQWGGDVQIADCDMTNVVLSDGQTRATTRVQVAWYDQRSMEVTGTVLAQHWTMTENGFLLEREEIVAGDPTLLILPDSEEPADSAGGEDTLASR